MLPNVDHTVYPGQTEERKFEMGDPLIGASFAGGHLLISTDGGPLGTKVPPVMLSMLVARRVYELSLGFWLFIGSAEQAYRRTSHWVAGLAIVCIFGSGEKRRFWRALT